MFFHECGSDNFTLVRPMKISVFLLIFQKKQGRKVGKTFHFCFIFYLGYTGQGSDFNCVFPKMAIKTLWQVLRFRVNSRNTGIYMTYLYLICFLQIIGQKHYSQSMEFELSDWTVDQNVLNLDKQLFNTKVQFCITITLILIEKCGPYV